MSGVKSNEAHSRSHPNVGENATLGWGTLGLVMFPTRDCSGKKQVPRFAQDDKSSRGQEIYLMMKVMMRLIAVLICLGGVAAAQAPPLATVEDTLPAMNVGVEFHTLLHAKGGVPPYVWSVAGGELPEGVTLTRDGLLSGRPTKPGSLALTLKVEDSGQPAHSVNKELQAVVTAALLLEWEEAPKVHDNRIDGSVKVSNGSKDDFDLTVVVVAVAENGRATAIGYEHFDLKAGATDVKIPFGNTPGYGGYVVHADAIAEIAARNVILRQRLQTAGALQILQGP